MADLNELLSGLMHYAEANNIDFDLELATALHSFASEQTLLPRMKAEFAASAGNALTAYSEYWRNP